MPKFGSFGLPSASPDRSFFDSFESLSLSSSLGASDGSGGSSLGESGLGASKARYGETVMEKTKREKEREKKRVLYVAMFLGLSGKVYKKDGDYEAAGLLHSEGLNFLFFSLLFFLLFLFSKKLKQKQIIALKKAKSAYGVRSPSLCPFLYDYGDVLRKVEKYDEASSIYQQALDLCNSQVR